MTTYTSVSVCAVWGFCEYAFDKNDYVGAVEVGFILAMYSCYSVRVLLILGCVGEGIAKICRRNGPEKISYRSPILKDKQSFQRVLVKFCTTERKKMIFCNKHASKISWCL